MKRSRFGRRSGLPREAEQLIWLASGLADSGSRAEDEFWESRLILSIDELLHSGDEDVLNGALDQLYATQPRSYEVLADLVESRAEAGALHDNDHEILLIAAPILAWSRFSIPSNTLPATTIANLRVHLGAHVLADNVQFSIADILFSPDQLPQGYCETARFAAELGRAAIDGHDMSIDPETLTETTRFLSDVRYILIAVTAARGMPLFRWQESDGSRDLSTAQWRTQGGPCLAPLLAGCAMELVLPDAYFAASRQADRASRPYSVRASVAFLSTTLEVAPNQLRAVVAPYYDRQLEEYRISFTMSGNNSVIHGVVWPLLGSEDENAEIPAQIENALRECGITEIMQIETRFPMEYCDDCGAPMYPSPEGEPAHAELPEDKAEQVPKHLH